MMKTRILKELKEAGDYISGQELCEKLQVSRTAVWKHIKALREEGYRIDSVTNKGYKLLDSPDSITAEEIGSDLDTEWLGRNLRYYETIDSTNLEIRRLAEEGAPHGTTAVAEEQTSGKGRRGRSWLGKAGCGIWMSFLLRPQIAVENSSMLTLITALAVEKAVGEETGLQCQIKWPNDIIVNGKKLCGILTELSAQMDELNYVVVGIGINANMQEFPDDLRDKATSLRIETGETVKRASLAARVLKYFEAYYEKFIKTEDLSAFADEYNRLLIHMNRKIRVIRGSGEDFYISRGINDKGELMVEDDAGKKSVVLSGEVSVRGVLGYV